MSFICKAKITRCNFPKTQAELKSTDFRIFSASPIGKCPNELKLSKYFTFSIRGNISYLDVEREYDLELEIFSSDSTWGDTCTVIGCPTLEKIDVENLSREESKEILMDCTSSEKIAESILSAYPNFIYKILFEGKESIDTKLIHGVGNSYLTAYTRILTDKYKYIHIMKNYKQYSLDVQDCKTLFSIYNNNENIEKAIEETPYRVLINDLGRQFCKIDRQGRIIPLVDETIMNSRPDLESSTQRAEFMVLNVLDRNEEDCSTKISANLLYDVCLDYNCPKLIPLLKEVCQSSDLIYYNEEKNEVAKMLTYNAECLVSSFVKDKLSKDSVLDIDYTKYSNIDGFQMSEKQTSALKLFCENEIMILAGVSGGGKTTSLKGLIQLMEDNDLTYCLLSPSGKASMRMKEATGRQASTIHRRVLGGGEIYEDVCVVDETSMVDLSTFTMLINAITNKDCRIVLVGDNFQLMPVGIGCVFNDLINSGKIPMVMLDEVFRYNTDGGLFVATNTRLGIPFFNSDKVKVKDNTYSVGNNYKFIQTDNILDDVVNEYMKLIAKGIKPKDILCLSPFNVYDEGTYAINNVIQKEINPLKPNEDILTRKIPNGYKGSMNIDFKLGDKTINKKNDYSAIPFDSWKELENDEEGILTIEDLPTTTLFNGQDGIIRNIDKEKMVIQFDEELIVVPKSKLQNVLLSYAISTHSSQGSEANYVINVVSPSHKEMLNRNLLYVADTRSKIMQIDIGDKDTYNKALLIDGNKVRNTFLKDLLLEDNSLDNPQ